MKNPFVIDHLARTMQPQKAKVDSPKPLELPHLGLDPDPIGSLAKAEERFDAAHVSRGANLLATGKAPQTGGDHQAINKAAHEYPGLVKKEQDFFKPTPITTFQRYLPDFLKRK